MQSIFDFPEEKLQISQVHDMLDGSDWAHRTAHAEHVTEDLFEGLHAKVKQKFDPTSERVRRTLHSGSGRDVFCFCATRTTS